MSDTENTIQATPKRDFKDAGTERNFTAGQSVALTPGEFANYEAAGLVARTPEENTAVLETGPAAEPVKTARTRS